MPFTFKNSQKAVAAFILLAIFAFITLLVLIGKGSDLFSIKQTYFTQFLDGNGLGSGSPVKYKGITIGKITRVTLLTNESVKVELSILEDYRYLVKNISVLKIASGLVGASGLSLNNYTHQLNTNILIEPRPLLPGSLIFSSDMPEGQNLMMSNVVIGPKKDDLTAKAMDVLDMILEWRSVMNLTLLNAREMTSSLNEMLYALKGQGNTLVTDKLIAILENVRVLTKSISGNNRIDSILGSLDSTLAGVKTIADRGEIQNLTLLLRENLVELKNTLKVVSRFFGGGGDANTIIKSGDRN